MNHLFENVRLRRPHLLVLRGLALDVNSLRQFFHSNERLDDMKLDKTKLRSTGTDPERCSMTIDVTRSSSSSFKVTMKGDVPQVVQSAFRAALESRCKVQRPALNTVFGAGKEEDS